MLTRRNLIALSVIALFLLIPPIITWASDLKKLKVVSETKAQEPEIIELGTMLFFDRRLSGDGTMSCATCHIPGIAFTDGQMISLSYPTTKSWRNTPTLINTAFSQTFFHDGRAETLEEQALVPIVSPFEMNQNLGLLEEELRAVPEYVERFKTVFGSGEITRERIAMAIAAFERRLISRNSPLDQFLQGNQEALTADAKKGLEIFTGKGKCTNCHYGVNLSDDKVYALHVPENPVIINDPLMAATLRFVAKINGYNEFENLKEDLGRYLITKDQRDWKAFKTPTLREISKTGPYMHNGLFGTLDEVIDFFDRGGGKGNVVLKPIGLTDQEKGYLKRFLLEGLNGEEMAIQTPKIP